MVGIHAFLLRFFHLQPARLTGGGVLFVVSPQGGDPGVFITGLLLEAGNGGHPPHLIDDVDLHQQVHAGGDHAGGIVRGDALLTAKQSRQAPQGFLGAVGVQGAGPGVAGHHGPEQRHGRVAVAHLAQHQVIGGHAHGIVHPVRQGVGRHFRADHLLPGFDGLDRLAVDPDLLRVFDLDDPPALRQEVT